MQELCVHTYYFSFILNQYILPIQTHYAWGKKKNN